MTTSRKPRTYPVKSVVHVVDGDTVDLLVDLGFYARMQVRFRMVGIDTPELRAPTLAMGHEAARVLAEFLRLPFGIEVESFGQADKYGPRWDGRVRVLAPGESIDVGAAMLRTGYALPYSGQGPRPTWDPRQPYPLPQRYPLPEGAR